MSTTEEKEAASTPAAEAEAKAEETAVTFTPVTEHGELTKVLENVYVVVGSFAMGPGIRISRTMQIVKRGDELTIFNSIRVSEAVEEEIKKLGTIKNLVRICASHGCDDPYYISTFKPTFYSIDGCDETAGAKPDKKLAEDGEMPVSDMKVVRLNTKIVEAVVWIPDDGGTLITSDVLQNTTDTATHASFIGKGLTWAMGFKGECKCVPLWIKNNDVDGFDFWPDVERFLALDFENLVPAHGSPKIGGAKEICKKNLLQTFKKEPLVAENK